MQSDCCSGQALAVSFWVDKTLAELNPAEWEALCDGCGKCCLHKLEDEDTGRLYYTDVACRLLDVERCRCRDYQHRHEQVPDCLKLTLLEPMSFKWLPETCAYRLRSEGKPLFAWHPLVSGDSGSVDGASISVSGWAVSEADLPIDTDLQAHILADDF